MFSVVASMVPKYRFENRPIKQRLPSSATHLRVAFHKVEARLDGLHVQSGKQWHRIAQCTQPCCRVQIMGKRRRVDRETDGLELFFELPQGKCASLLLFKLRFQDSNAIRLVPECHL